MRKTNPVRKVNATRKRSSAPVRKFRGRKSK